MLFVVALVEGELGGGDVVARVLAVLMVTLVEGEAQIGVVGGEVRTRGRWCCMRTRPPVGVSWRSRGCSDGGSCTSSASHSTR